MPKRRQPRRHRADSAKRREIAATTKPTQEFFDFHGDELGVDELEAQLLNQTIDSPFTSIDGHLDIDDGNGHQDHGEFEADELYLQALNSASLNDAIQLAKAAVELDPGLLVLVAPDDQVRDTLEVHHGIVLCSFAEVFVSVGTFHDINRLPGPALVDGIL